MEWIVSLGIAFGGTYALSVPLRTARYPRLFWSTFILVYITAALSLIFAELDVKHEISLGLSGFALGLLLFLVRKGLLKIEKRYDQTKISRGE